MTNEIIIKAIQKINPTAEISVSGNDINTIEWHNGTTPISKADIEAKMAELPTAEEEATARENLKASAKAKLIAGEPLTAEEADTIVL